jgi:hypothetical protein
MKLFHGSRENNLKYDNGDICNIYAGSLFFSECVESAASHGPFIYSVEIEEDAILSHKEFVSMQYSSDVDVFAILKEVALDAGLNVDSDEKLERLAELVIDNIGTYGWMDEDVELLNAFDLTEMGWEAQRLRFILAQKLGYNAVEVIDEHGISFMVLNPQLKQEF